MNTKVRVLTGPGGNDGSKEAWKPKRLNPAKGAFVLLSQAVQQEQGNIKIALVHFFEKASERFRPKVGI